jgi:hypothetical protein
MIARFIVAALLGAAAAVAAAAAPAKPPVNECDVFYGPNWKPLEGMQVATAPNLPRPAKGVPFRDPAHGTCVVRVTAHDKEPPKGFARNDYSRRQAFNADDTLVLVVAQDGHWHLYDANTWAHLDALKEIGGDAEPQWHPTDPNLLYFLPANGIGLKLFELNIRYGQMRTVADFGDRLRKRWPRANAAWTRSEGSPSVDGRYWCFQVDDPDWQALGIFTWDMVQDRIIAMHDQPGDRPDHVSMSPGGGYCVVSGDSKGTTAYTRELTAPKTLLKGTEHSDLAFDAKGDEVYVAIDYDASGGPVFMTDLRSGRRTELFRTYLDGTVTALHISGRAFKAPGWVLVSTYADEEKRGHAGLQWLHRRIFAVSLDSKPRIIPLAHHHSTYAKYFTEPHASVNRDLTRIMFNSNWGTSSETDVDAYMVILPPRMPWSRP